MGLFSTVSTLFTGCLNFKLLNDNSVPNSDCLEKALTWNSNRLSKLSFEHNVQCSITYSWKCGEFSQPAAKTTFQKRLSRTSRWTHFSLLNTHFSAVVTRMNCMGIRKWQMCRKIKWNRILLCQHVGMQPIQPGSWIHMNPTIQVPTQSHPHTQANPMIKKYIMIQ